MASRKKRKAARRLEYQATTETRLRNVTRIYIMAGHEFGHDDAKIRADITAALKGAFGEPGAPAPIKRTTEVDGKIEEWGNSAAAFAMIFERHGLDHRDPHVQETAFAVVVDELDQALRPAG